DKTKGIATNDNANFYFPYVLDPSNDKRLLLGTDRVYETTNQGDQWASISAPNLNGWNTTAAIDAIAATTNPDIIYATASGTFLATTDHGKSWHVRNVTLQDRFGNFYTVNDHFSDIQVDPEDPDIVYLTRNKFNDPTNNQLGHVFRSTDAGKSWTDISGTLP